MRCETVPESRAAQWVLDYLKGPHSPVARKKGWQLAERVGDATHFGLLPASSSMWMGHHTFDSTLASERIDTTLVVSTQSLSATRSQLSPSQLQAMSDLFDETSRQLTGDVRPPIKAAPGRVERYDTEYQRNGTRNLFMFCEPKGGWRHVEVTGRRTAVDFAHQMKWLVDEAL